MKVSAKVKLKASPKVFQFVALEIVFASFPNLNINVIADLRITQRSKNIHAPIINYLLNLINYINENEKCLIIIIRVPFILKSQI